MWYEEVKITIPPDINFLIKQVFPPINKAENDCIQGTTESDQPILGVQEKHVRSGFNGQ